MIEVTASQIEQAERLLAHVPGAAPKALYRSINRAAETARTEAARKVRQTYFISHSDVISTIKIRPASEQNLTARIISRGHAISLIKYRVTPKQPEPLRKGPIIVRVKRGGGGPLRGGAFVARMKSGHIGVFLRAGKRRLPIGEKFGPPIPEMLGNPNVSAWIEQKAKERLDQRLEHEISRILEGHE